MHDPEMETFLGLQKKSDFRQKQERFDQKALLILLRGLEEEAGLASRLQKLVGDEFGLAWFVQACPNFPVRLASYKSAKKVPFTALMKKPEKSRIYTEMEEARDSYPDGLVGVIFASVGDGMPEMVIHNCTEAYLCKEEPYWRVELPGDEYVVDPLTGFVAMLKRAFDWRLSKEVCYGQQR